MPKRFSADARAAVIHAAAVEAARRGDAYLSTEHLLLALLADPAGIATQALALDPGEARAALRRFDGVLTATGPDPNPAEPPAGDATPATVPRSRPRQV